MELNHWRNIMKKQILNFVLGAITVVSTCGVAEAANFYRTSEYSPIGVEACEVIPSSFSQSQDCYQSIRGVYFDSSMQGFCSDNMPYFEVQKCLNAIANKTFDPVEVNICKNEASFNRAKCAARFGRDITRYSPRPSQGDVIDALDQLLIDLIRDAFATSAVSSSEVCDVQNSTGRSLGTVSRSDFRNVAQRFARSQNSCVVTNIKNERRSRELLSSTGRSLGQELTEEETKRLKDRNYYDRCRVLTCVSETRQVRRPRVQYDRYDRNDNNYRGGYDQMPTPTWGTR
jgi:hypothetical protein